MGHYDSRQGICMKHGAEIVVRFPPCVSLAYRTAVAPSAGGRGYYYWLMSLTQIALHRKSTR